MDYLKMFIDSAIKQAQYEQMGDAEKSDEYGFKIHKIAAELYNLGRISELCKLLEHEHPVVRGNAAIELLPIAEEKAEIVLEELASRRGMAIYFTAKMTLKEWRKGNLKFDYYKK